MKRELGKREVPIKASDPRPAPDPMNRRRLRTHSMDEAAGIFLGAADGSWPSPSLEPLYIFVTNSRLLSKTLYLRHYKVTLLILTPHVCRSLDLAEIREARRLCTNIPLAAKDRQHIQTTSCLGHPHFPTIPFSLSLSQRHGPLNQALSTAQHDNFIPPIPISLPASTRPLAAIVGGAGGSLALLVIVIGFVWFWLCHCKKYSNKNSDTNSSDPSTVELKRRGGPTSYAGPRLFGPHGVRQFTMEELEQATNHFAESSLIGYGSFGLVFKGLLRDGTVVAIKRRTGFPRQEFVEEVAYLSGIQHRNLVTLLGYCQDNGYQMLVFEYLPNGSISNHLYGMTHTLEMTSFSALDMFKAYWCLTDIGKDSTTKLEFKQRLSIALGVAKGLCHLHSQQPPIVHRNLKTSNVLIDESLIAKVADAGVSRLLERIEDAGPSHSTRVDVFEDPEVGRTGIVSERSDVYSFGVFLLELITGQEASHINSFGSQGSILQWVCHLSNITKLEAHMNSNDLIDRRLVGRFTDEGMKDYIRLMLRCMSFLEHERPKMETIISELDRTLEKEIMLTTAMGEGTATVTLGSKLFTSD
ncbi:hypothetical protein RJ639_018877 [Escallonia herrerae]|uniref:non-specific serine/threonine protein kinase n=1 Tax=Escallonia herrerae TaxID=1293975 RepID=A0AA88V7I2_9ASTE|nr:hypothetical protein RJ639_018877 [Escallonia herrerae]